MASSKARRAGTSIGTTASGVMSSKSMRSSNRSQPGCCLFGRVTYEGMAGYWPSQKGEVADFMNTIPKIVFSKTLKKAEWNNTRLVKGKPEEEVAKLKQQPGKDLFVFGSANLSATLLAHGLFDEIDLALAPVVLCGGNPLFKSSADRIKMTLLEARPLKSGGVILRYEPDRKKTKSR